MCSKVSHCISSESGLEPKAHPQREIQVGSAGPDLSGISIGGHLAGASGVREIYENGRCIGYILGNYRDH